MPARESPFQLKTANYRNFWVPGDKVLKLYSRRRTEKASLSATPRQKPKEICESGAGSKRAGMISPSELPSNLNPKPSLIFKFHVPSQPVLHANHVNSYFRVPLQSCPLDKKPCRLSCRSEDSEKFRLAVAAYWGLARVGGLRGWGVQSFGLRVWRALGFHAYGACLREHIDS